MARPVQKLWRGPLLMAGLSILGLASALAPFQWGDQLAWLTLSVPLFYTISCLIER